MKKRAAVTSPKKTYFPKTHHLYIQNPRKPEDIIEALSNPVLRHESITSIRIAGGIEALFHALIQRPELLQNSKIQSLAHLEFEGGSLSWITFYTLASALPNVRHLRLDQVVMEGEITELRKNPPSEQIQTVYYTPFEAFSLHDLSTFDMLFPKLTDLHLNITPDYPHLNSFEGTVQALITYRNAKSLTAKQTPPFHELKIATKGPGFSTAITEKAQQLGLSHCFLLEV